MIRDSLKEKKHFDYVIHEEQERKNKKKKEIDTKDYKDDFARRSLYLGIFEQSLHIVMSMYSRGDSLEDIKESYLKALEDYYIAFKEGGINYRDSFSPEYDFSPLIYMLSMAILFDIEGEHLNKLLTIVKTAPKYKVIHNFLAYWNEDEKEAREGDFEKAYKKLNEMSELSNEEILKNKLMNKYLKSWYNSETRVILKDAHSTKLARSYYGYWAFEAAAFVKMRGLDDSSFRDNVYYPKDMITLDKI